MKERKRKKVNLNTFLSISNLPQASRLNYLAGGKENFVMLFALIVALIVILIASAVMVTWGILTLIGLILVSTGAGAILLDRYHGSYIFVIALIVGLIFLVLPAVGLDLGTVNLGDVPGLQSWHDLFN